MYTLLSINAKKTKCQINIIEKKIYIILNYNIYYIKKENIMCIIIYVYSWSQKLI